MNSVPRRESNPARRANLPGGPGSTPARRPNLPGGPGSTHKPRPDLNTPLASTYKAPDYKENKYITFKEQNALPIDWDKD